MKSDCSHVLTQFASFSVEELTDSEAASLLHHLEACEPCKGQWLLFEKTLLVTTQSGPRDEDVEQTRSQQMWLVCLEHARKNAEKHHSLPAESAHAAPPAKPAKAEHKNPEHHETKSADAESSVLVAPRVGMMLVGGALLLLASAHWLAPRPQHTDTALPPMPTQLQTVGFQSVPRSSASLVDYGATLGFDALSDHVEPTLISAPTRNARPASAAQLP